MSGLVVLDDISGHTAIESCRLDQSLVSGGGQVLCNWKTREGSIGNLVEKGQPYFLPSLLEGGADYAPAAFL